MHQTWCGGRLGLQFADVQNCVGIQQHNIHMQCSHTDEIYLSARITQKHRQDVPSNTRDVYLYGWSNYMARKLVGLYTRRRGPQIDVIGVYETSRPRHFAYQKMGFLVSALRTFPLRCNRRRIKKRPWIVTATYQCPHPSAVEIATVDNHNYHMFWKISQCTAKVISAVLINGRIVQVWVVWALGVTTCLGFLVPQCSCRA